MTPDLHGLISQMAAELDRCQQLLLDDRRQRHPLADHARAALARWGNHPGSPDSSDGPAVPEGREPASVVSEPSDEELDELAWNWYSKTGSTWYQVEAFRAFARAVLARWGRQPAPPADGDYREDWDMSSKDGSLCFASAILSRLVGVDVLDEADLQWLAAYLQANSTPQPVAVSERLPGDALCWWYEPDEDDDGSGYGGNWTLLRIRGGVSCYTHWLPAHALPTPEATND